MPFEKVETQNVDFPAFERDVLKFWDENGIFEKLRAKIAGKPRWSFLDGPITANNPMGVHHAWGRTYKDAYNRYFAMIGRDLRYQNGFDCQGLWVEVEVEKELGLKTKRDIENLVPGDREASVAKFVQLCKDRVNKFARVQTEQSIRLGMWMDWDRTDEDWAKSPDERKSYFTMSERNNFTIWSFLKKCHEKGLIYRGYDVMPWCGRCGVGISEQEMKEGYKTIEHRACFVKLPLTDKPGENLLVWTTTPWTLTSNVGAAVNPDLTYLQVKLKGEIYYVAKGAFKLNRMESSGDDEDGEPGASATGGSGSKKSKREWLDGVPHLKSIEQLFKEKAGKDGFEIAGEVKGSELVGRPYAGPFDDLPAQQHEYGFPADVARVVKERGWSGPVTGAAAHKVVSGGKDVTEGEGTGIVHTAPGCGQIDFQWGKDNGLPPVAPIGDDGCFHAGFGPLTGKNAAEASTADAVFEELKKKDRLFAIERYVHRYPHCWRCKTELLYRLVDEWFINMGPRNTEEGFRGEVMKVVKQVEFLPASINGQARERDWLWNMGDWMISKKRFWGLALPIWVDEVTGDFEVIGSREELKERAVEGWQEFDGNTPHRPFVDRVKIKNPKTGNLMARIPDVGNPWLDAGIVAFSTLPADWYPADFITESFPGQFRNWFYALLTMSTMMSGGKAPFKTLFGFALVRDENGKEMHKSAGNSIEFNSAAEELGADAMRWLYCRQNPAANLNFGPKTVHETRSKFHIKLWNCYAFFANYARLDGFDPTAPQVPVKDRPDIDRWILSDLQGLISTARDSFEKYDVMSFCLEAERFVDDRLSNWYVRRNRDRFWSKNAELDAAGKQDKLAAYQTMYTVLTTVTKLIAPVVPFLAETMWKNLRTDADEESVHLTEYPITNDSFVDRSLSDEFEFLLWLVSLGLAARNEAKIKVRQPLAEIKVENDKQVASVALKYKETLQEELNVKHISVFDPSTDNITLTRKVVPDRQKLGPKFGSRLNEVLTAIEQLNPDVVENAKNNSIPAIALALPSGDVAITRNDVKVRYNAPEGWTVAKDLVGYVLLNTRITPELKAEGVARDVVRLVQDARKDAGLDVADQIELYLAAESPELTSAITVHRATIAGETQAARWADAPLNGDAFTATGKKIDGQQLTISLRKV